MKLRKLAVSLLGLFAFAAQGQDDFDGERHRQVYGWEPEYLDQRWTAEERRRFYFTPQGSYILPYDWYIALQSADNAFPFNHPRNISRYGYLVDDEAYSGNNPDGLPVGFAKEPVANGEAWVGYSCAACHTNDLRFRGHTLRIDGAPALADFTAFNDGLIAALNGTLQSKRKFARFAWKVLGGSASEAEKADLRARVAGQTARLTELAQRSKPTHAYGAGRVDAFGIITNEVFGTDLGLPENLKEPNAPVSYPFLWGTPRQDFVQWNGSAFNPFGRNVGEVLGTFGRVNLNPASPEFTATSARGRELFELERLVAKLGSPRWPENLLGPIDRDSAARGRAVYTQQRNGEESCADCHALPGASGHYPQTPAAENAFGVTFDKTQMTPLAEIGTDPAMALNFAQKRVKTGAVAPLLPAPFTNAEELPAPALLSILVGLAVQSSIRATDPAFTDAERAELIGYRIKAPGLPPYSAAANLGSYRARSLDGVWATAPYLHNGSVPNLYELLLPEKQRSVEFSVGSREFDPERIGFRSKAGWGKFRFDTRLPGNRNTGHPYGTDLTENERRDLLEFLKTL